MGHVMITPVFSITPLSLAKFVLSCSRTTTTIKHTLLTTRSTDKLPGVTNSRPENISQTDDKDDQPPETKIDFPGISTKKIVIIASNDVC
jgi:hypothetical protein